MPVSTPQSDPLDEFIEESSARHADAIQALLGSSSRGNRILDLGCGRNFIAPRYLHPRHYIGIDPNCGNPRDMPWSNEVSTIRVIQRSYRLELDGLIDLVRDDMSLHDDPDVSPVFTAFFSTEMSGGPVSNSEVYTTLFNELPVVWGLVCGIYRVGHEYDNYVIDLNSQRSYQTIDLLDPSSSVYEERRLYFEAPSIALGTLVVEVWRLFRRRM